jgi:uncharacterized protein YjbI with pentapeptide repeats
MQLNAYIDQQMVQPLRHTKATLPRLWSQTLDFQNVDYQKVYFQNVDFQNVIFQNVGFQIVNLMMTMLTLFDPNLTAPRGQLPTAGVRL